MTESHNTPGAPTLVAIDIAKGRHDVLVEPPAPGRRRRFRMTDSVEDYESLADYLRKIGTPALMGSRRPVTIIGRWPIFFSARASSCGSSPPWRWPEPGKRCTTRGIKMIPKTLWIAIYITSRKEALAKPAR